MKQKYLQTINELVEQGAGGVIYRCTEIPVLSENEKCSVPSFDPTMLQV